MKSVSKPSMDATLLAILQTVETTHSFTEFDMKKITLFKTVRLIIILAAALVIVTPVLAQGTVPPGGPAQTLSGTTSGTLELQSGWRDVFPPGSCLGSCTLSPTLDPLAQVTPPPAGSGTMLSGVNLQISNPPGVFGVPFGTLSYPTTLGLNAPTVGANGQVTNFTIMNFDTTLVPPRWVALPTFFDPATGRLYTNVRLQGNFALFGQ